MDLEPATKIFKKAHEIVRRTGIGHEGKKLSELERAQRQYLQDLSGRANFKIDW